MTKKKSFPTRKGAFCKTYTTTILTATGSKGWRCLVCSGCWSKGRYWSRGRDCLPWLVLECEHVLECERPSYSLALPMHPALPQNISTDVRLAMMSPCSPLPTPKIHFVANTFTMPIITISPEITEFHKSYFMFFSM